MCAKSTREKGAGSEDLARSYLQRQGYRIMDTNFRIRTGEIDIIAMDNDTIVFIEVKSAASKNFGDPASWVPVWKQNRIIRVSQAYLMRKNLYNSPARFDVLAIDTSQGVNHVKDAFRPGPGIFV